MPHISIFQNISFLLFALCYTFTGCYFSKVLFGAGEVSKRREQRKRRASERGLQASEPTRICRPSLSLSLSSDRDSSAPAPGIPPVTLPLISGPHA